MSEYFSGDKKILDNIGTVPDRRGGSRRRHQRFHVTIDTILECGNILYTGAILDISRKGCRVRTANAIRTATNQVTLKFIFPGELDTRYARGRITWIRKHEAGFMLAIEFEKPQNL
jgi:hypothetical protein